MQAVDNNMTDTSDFVFRHEPLPDATSYIRLLTPKEYEGDDDAYTLECELSTWPIDDCPAFYAISYCWGDPADTALLRVNGLPLDVTENCELALCQASLCAATSDKQRRGAFSSSYFWCDAVCIDQGDQAEKEAQVAAMGRIYRRARQVLVCLGPPVGGPDSPFLFRKLRSRSRRLGRIGEHWQGRAGKFHVDKAMVADDEWRRMVVRFLLSMPRCTIMRLCTALESLVGTAYFQRTWIYQEVFLGKSVIVCCGVDHVPISSIYGLAQASTLLASSWRIKLVDRLWGLFHPRSTAQQLRDFDCDWTRYFLWLLGSGSSYEPRPGDLGSLIWEIRYQDCGDVRDKVYGTLSMVNWPDGEAISVDYDRDPIDLAIQVMKVIRKRPGVWHGRWHDVADMVALNLLLGAQPSEKLDQQIWKRRSPVTRPLRDSMKAQSRPRLPLAVEYEQYDTFWGYRLVRKGEQWALEGGALPFGGLAEGRNIRIRSWHVDLCPWDSDEMSEDIQLDDIFIPPVAQPGDWCLMHTRGRPLDQLDSDISAMGRYLRIDRAVLIGRESCDGPEYPLSVIGKGLVDSDLAYLTFEHPITTEFKVYFDDEDALVLAASVRRTSGFPTDESSETRKMNKKAFESEHSFYFNTMVSGGMDSTYAVRVKEKTEYKEV